MRPGIAIVTAARRLPVLGHVGLSSRARLPSKTRGRSAGGVGGSGNGNPTPISGPRDAPAAVGKHTRATSVGARRYYNIVIIVITIYCTRRRYENMRYQSPTFLTWSKDGRECCVMLSVGDVVDHAILIVIILLFKNSR